ncbi:16S rRNA (cytosine(1402)-N(4))-methyltransferase RsmH [Candidatus Parcubacteria bacterium]|nr:16S rRNA (cytosine(1402)-N(4))-methyltransferase RsmH [Candidatus Parcubacteria bacterium]
MRHVPVLLHEAVEALNLRDGDIFLDGTLGGAGHSLLVAEKFGDDVEIIGLDRDIEALERSGERLRELTKSAYLKLESFRNLDTVLESLGIEKINAVLLDLGISSEQLEESGRGFSFQKDEPLEMTMEKDKKGVTAKEVLNHWDEDTLELVLRGFGEEKFSRRIAAEIVRRREEKPFETTGDLLEAVRLATPASAKRHKIHPATRTFQAIRIAVNEELTALEEGLKKAFEVLAPKGRLAVISFHSLEDRIVKNFMRDLAREGRGKLITKKPITPSEEEVKNNPRSRSAKLRILEKNED